MRIATIGREFDSGGREASSFYSVVDGFFVSNFAQPPVPGGSGSLHQIFGTFDPGITK